MGVLKRFAVCITALALVMTGAFPSFAEGDDGYKVIYTSSIDEDAFNEVLPVDEESYKKGDIAKILEPTSLKINKDEDIYEFCGWLVDGIKAENEIEIGEEDVTLVASWEKEPVIHHVLSGIVYTHDFNKPEATGSRLSNVALTLLLKDDEEAEVKTDDDGKFTFEIPEGKTTENGKYSYYIQSDEERLGSLGSLLMDEENEIYVRKRYEPSDEDWTLPDQENALNGVIREFGTYVIEGKNGKKLSKELDGKAEERISVSIAKDGSIEPFYVYPDGSCSIKYSNGMVSVDDEAPVLLNVSASAGDSETQVKTHGIYAKTKANLVINASIRDEGSGLNKVYVVGKKDGVETKYEASKVTGKDGVYEVSIGLPGEKTMMDAEVMYLVSEDAFGNKSETLISKTEEGSSVTLELMPPVLEHEVTPPSNEDGWYSELPSIKAIAEDTLSGLSELEILQNGDRIAYLEIPGKELSKRSIEAKSSATIKKSKKNI